MTTVQNTRTCLLEGQTFVSCKENVLLAFLLPFCNVLFACHIHVAMKHKGQNNAVNKPTAVYLTRKIP